MNSYQAVSRTLDKGIVIVFVLQLILVSTDSTTEKSTQHKNMDPKVYLVSNSLPMIFQ